MLNPPTTDTNYGAWMGAPAFLNNAYNAFNRSKQAAQEAKEKEAELAMKRQKAMAGGDFNAPNYEAKLRDELFSKSGDLKSLQASQASFKGMESAMKSGSDIAMLYHFIKSMDPGSVVREGEVALTRLGVPGLDEAARRLTNAMKTGQTADIITPALREQFYNYSRMEMANRMRAYRQAEDRIKGLADQYAPYGVSSERVIPGGSYLRAEDFSPDIWNMAAQPYAAGGLNPATAAGGDPTNSGLGDAPQSIKDAEMRRLKYLEEQERRKRAGNMGVAQ